MEQSRWRFRTDSGKNYIVILKHHPTKGHVAISANGEIIKVEFKVFEPKKFTFFIEGELCTVEILKNEEGEFEYDFTVDEEADTPHNNQKKAREKKEYRNNVIIRTLALVAVVSFISFFVYRMGQNKSDELAQRGVIGIATATIKEYDEKKQLTYSFSYAGKTFHTQPEFIEGKVYSEQGFPIEDTDEFFIKFVPFNPLNYEVNTQSSPGSMSKVYFGRTYQKHLLHNPKEDEGYLECMLLKAYERDSVTALLDFYFQTADPDENPKFNKNTYGRRVRDAAFAKAVEEACWDLR